MQARARGPTAKRKRTSEINGAISADSSFKTGNNDAIPRYDFCQKIWRGIDVRLLLQNIRNCIPEGDTSKYSTLLIQFNWEKAKFANFSAEDCQMKWCELMTNIRCHRTLGELVADAEELVGDLSNCSTVLREPIVADEEETSAADVPPDTAFTLFYLERRKEIVVKCPLAVADEKHLRSKIAKEYLNLPADKKKVYESRYKGIEKLKKAASPQKPKTSTPKAKKAKVNGWEEDTSKSEMSAPAVGKSKDNGCEENTKTKSKSSAPAVGKSKDNGCEENTKTKSKPSAPAVGKSKDNGCEENAKTKSKPSAPAVKKPKSTSRNPKSQRAKKPDVATSTGIEKSPICKSPEKKSSATTKDAKKGEKGKSTNGSDYVIDLNRELKVALEEIDVAGSKDSSKSKSTKRKSVKATKALDVPVVNSKPKPKPSPVKKQKDSLIQVTPVEEKLNEVAGYCCFAGDWLPCLTDIDPSERASVVQNLWRELPKSTRDAYAALQNDLQITSTDSDLGHKKTEKKRERKGEKVTKPAKKRAARSSPVEIPSVSSSEISLSDSDSDFESTKTRKVRTPSITRYSALGIDFAMDETDSQDSD